MLISMWTNAVMFRLNVQNVLRRLQRRLSVACLRHSLIAFVNHFLVQTIPFLLDTLAQLFHTRNPVVHGCTHTLAGSPTPRSRWGSDPADRYPNNVWCWHRQYSFNSTQRQTFSVFLLLHRASAVLILLSCAYLLMKKAFYAIFNKNNCVTSDVIICKEYINYKQILFA